MIMKRPRHRVFDYEPRFYKPEEDPDEKRKRKLGFRRSRKQLKKGRSPLYWLIILIIILHLYLRFINII